MTITNEIIEDVECLKYFLKNGTLNGSIIRLARMVRIMYVVLFILMIIVVLWRIL